MPRILLAFFFSLSYSTSYLFEGFCRTIKPAKETAEHAIPVEIEVSEKINQLIWSSWNCFDFLKTNHIIDEAVHRPNAVHEGGASE